MIGEHRQAIELFSMAAQRGNTDPRYQWAASNAFSHYCWGNMTLRFPGRAKPVRESQPSSGARDRAAALAQLGRADEAANAAEVLLSNYPTLTVERHLRNFHWKIPADIAHYRDGLLKAGIPFQRLTLVGSAPKLAADS